MLIQRINPHVVTASLFASISATFVIGLIGLAMNWWTQPETAFERVISTTSGVVALTVSVALAAIVLKWRKVQLVAAVLVCLLALHSLLVTLSINHIFFLGWLSRMDAYFYPPVAILFIVLGSCLAMSPEHRLQRLWQRVLSLLMLAVAGIFLVLHIIPNGFMVLGPHPAVTSIAGLVIFLVSISLLLVSIIPTKLIAFPSPKAMLLGFIAVFLTCGTWYYLSYENIRSVQVHAQTDLNKIAHARQQMVAVNIQLMERMTERWQANNINMLDDTQKNDIDAYLRDIPHLLNLSLLDQDRQRRWHQGKERTNTISVHFGSPEVQNWLNQPHPVTELFIPESTFRGSSTPLAYMILPIDYSDQSTGYLLAMFDFNRLLNPDTRMLPESLKIYIQLSTNVVTSFDESKPYHRNELRLAETNMTLPQGPSLLLFASLYSFDDLVANANLRIVIAFLGLTFSLLFMLMYEQNRQLQLHSGRLQHIQRRLRTQRHALKTSEQRYRSLFEQNPDAVFSLDPEGNFIAVNQSVEELLDTPAETIIGVHFRQFVEDDDLERIVGIFTDVLSGRSHRYEARCRDIHGTHLDLDIINLPIVVDGEVKGTYGIAKNITQRKQQDERLQLLQRSVDHSVNGIVIADAVQNDFPIVYVNKAFERMTGYQAIDVIGRNCRFLQGSETSPEAVQALRHAISRQEEVRVQLINYRKSGERFWNELFLSPVRNEQNIVTHYIGVQHDVSQQVANKERLAYNASRDGLTGLANRNTLETAIAELVKQHRSDLDENILATLFIDLDGFKPINDTLGLEVGDAILIEVARRLQRTFCHQEVISRFGGDEYVVVISHLQKITELTELVFEALTSIGEPYDVTAGQKIYLTASIGVALYEPDVKYPLELIQRADIAMTRAKQYGHNHFQFYSAATSARFQADVVLRSQFQQALDNEELDLHYQPIYQLETGKVVGVEALMRWQLADGKNVSPADFIPLAETTGQIIPASEWALDRACRDSKRLQEFGDLTVSVNVSALQFHRAEFLDYIMETLHRHELSAQAIELELTESVLMDNTDYAIALLRKLRQSGLQIALDDFGTGFSGLSYLKQLPVTKLKVDQAFTQGIHSHESDEAITRGIIAMAKQLGITTVAEGIENAEQQQTLLELGAELGQGYYFARPMPFDQLVEFLKSASR
ncbi:EAL domain-containing protein [Pseudidiomarina aestuarii]|uniref:EAL domain-containing protein n=1 Tax=Pseudidiomarina aestuarii TaxID=624146 RepID=UPI003A97FE2B